MQQIDMYYFNNDKYCICNLELLILYCTMIICYYHDISSESQHCCYLTNLLSHLKLTPHRPMPLPA